MSDLAAPAVASTLGDVSEDMWTPRRVVAVLLCALAVLIDGMDNQLLGLAVPSLLSDWHLHRAAFQPVFALSFLSLALGAIILGWLNDRAGRRVALLTGIACFSVGTVAMSASHTLGQLTWLRCFACIGMGGAVAVSVGLAAEFSPARHRTVVVNATAICFGGGGLIGGLLAASLLPTLGWRALFVTAGAISVLLGLVMAPSLPESPRFQKRSRVTGHLVDASAAAADHLTEGFRSLFSPALWRDSLGLWIAILAGHFSVYSIISWSPALLTGQGFSVAAASMALVVYNLGSIVGAIACGLAAAKIGSRVALVLTSLLGVVCTIALAIVPLDPAAGGLLMLRFIFAGATLGGLQASIYAVASFAYPDSVRGRGIGAMSASARMGALLSAFGAALTANGASLFFLTIAAVLFAGTGGLLLVRHHIPKRPG